MKQIPKFVSLSGAEKFLFFKALGLSFFVKLVVLTMPLRWYSRFLSWHEGKWPEPAKEEVIKSISCAVNRCSRYAPWKTRCLVDAITAKILLQREGIGSTLFLGVQKNEKNKLIAHAWLKCGDNFVTGKKGYQKFTVVSSFT